MTRDSTARDASRRGVPHQRAVAGCRSRATCRRRCERSPMPGTRGSCCLRSTLHATDAGALARVFAEHGLAPITIAGGQAGELTCRRRTPTSARPARQLLRSIVDLTRRPRRRSDERGAVRAVRPPGGPTSRAAVERSAREVGAVADYAHERGITMTFEVLNRYETSLVNTAAQAIALRRPERFGAPADPSGHVPHGDRGGRRVRGDPHRDAGARLPRTRPVRPRAAERGGRRHPRDRALGAGRRLRGPVGHRGVLALGAVHSRGGHAGDLAAPYDDGAELAADAMRVIQRGWSSSIAGRRAQRLSRGIPALSHLHPTPSDSTTKEKTMSTATETAQTLIDPAEFAGRIHIDGEWVIGGGGEIPSIEPATGETLAMVGMADAADVARAAEGAAARAEGVGGAAAPGPRRGAAQGRAAVGAVRRRDRRLEHPRGRCDPAARRIRPARDGGRVLRGVRASLRAARVDPLQRRAAPLARRAGAGRRGRGDLAVQRAADPRHPRGRARPRAGQRRAAQARPAHRHHRRRVDGADLRGGGAAGRAAAARARAAPRSARRWSPTRACA